MRYQIGVNAYIESAGAVRVDGRAVILTERQIEVLMAVVTAGPAGIENSKLPGGAGATKALARAAHDLEDAGVKKLQEFITATRGDASRCWYHPPVAAQEEEALDIRWKFRRDGTVLRLDDLHAILSDTDHPLTFVVGSSAVLTPESVSMATNPVLPSDLMYCPEIAVALCKPGFGVETRFDMDALRVRGSLGHVIASGMGNVNAFTRELLAYWANDRPLPAPESATANTVAVVNSIGTMLVVDDVEAGVLTALRNPWVKDREAWCVLCAGVNSCGTMAALRLLLALVRRRDDDEAILARFRGPRALNDDRLDTPARALRAVQIPVGELAAAIDRPIEPPRGIFLLRPLNPACPVVPLSPADPSLPER